MKEGMRILIAYDRSEGADLAIDDLCRAGLPEKANALIVSVAEVWLPPPDDDQQAENGEVEPLPAPPAIVRQMWARRELMVQHAKEMAERASRRVRHNFPDWSVQPEAVSGSPGWEILRLDAEWRPDLIVVGSYGHSAISRLVLGSVSQRVLTEARCSVRVGRGKTLVGEPRQRIVIGVDGSANSLAAVKEVATRRWLVESEAHIVVAHGPLTTTMIGGLAPSIAEAVQEINDSELAWAAQIAEKAAEGLRNADLAVSTIIEAGDPKRVLVSHAEDWGADSIFVGSTGVSSPVRKLLLGSVSAAVAARAQCAVEVVRVADS